MFGALRAHGGDIFTFAMRKKIKIDAKKNPPQFRMIETGTAVGEALQTNEAVAEDSFFFFAQLATRRGRQAADAPSKR